MIAEHNVVKPSIKQLIHKSAIKYGVSEEKMSNTIKCESQYNPNTVGDGGYSYGLVQIHLPSHPSVTKEQALNPEFATDFMAENFANGKAHMWTCYRKLYKPH